MHAYRAEYHSIRLGKPGNVKCGNPHDVTQPIEKPRNVVGPQIRVLRSRRGWLDRWSQPVLAAKYQLACWDVSRDIIARIELRVRWVADFELFLLAQVLDEPGTSLPTWIFPICSHCSCAAPSG